MPSGGFFRARSGEREKGGGDALRSASDALWGLFPRSLLARDTRLFARLSRSNKRGQIAESPLQGACLPSKATRPQRWVLACPRDSRLHTYECKDKLLIPPWLAHGTHRGFVSRSSKPPMGNLQSQREPTNALRLLATCLLDQRQKPPQNQKTGRCREGQLEHRASVLFLANPTMTPAGAIRLQGESALWAQLRLNA